MLAEGGNSFLLPRPRSRSADQMARHSCRLGNTACRRGFGQSPSRVGRIVPQVAAFDETPTAPLEALDMTVDRTPLDRLTKRARARYAVLTHPEKLVTCGFLSEGCNANTHHSCEYLAIQDFTRFIQNFDVAGKACGTSILSAVLQVRETFRVGL